MGRSPRLRLIAAAEKVGAEVEWDDVGHVITAYVGAPPGQVWLDGYVHTMVGSTHRGPHEWTVELVQDLLDRMACGLTACPFTDCDECKEASDEPVGSAGGGA